MWLFLLSAPAFPGPARPPHPVSAGFSTGPSPHTLVVPALLHDPEILLTQHPGHLKLQPWREGRCWHKRSLLMRGRLLLFNVGNDKGHVTCGIYHGRPLLLPPIIEASS